MRCIIPRSSFIVSTVFDALQCSSAPLPARDLPPSVYINPGLLAGMLRSASRTIDASNRINQRVQRGLHNSELPARLSAFSENLRTSRSNPQSSSRNGASSGTLQIFHRHFSAPPGVVLGPPSRATQQFRQDCAEQRAAARGERGRNQLDLRSYFFVLYTSTGARQPRASSMNPVCSMLPTGLFNAIPSSLLGTFSNTSQSFRQNYSASTWTTLLPAALLRLQPGLRAFHRTPSFQQTTQVFQQYYSELLAAPLRLPSSIH